MNKENKIPLIRFKGYTEDWEQRKVQNLCSISTGKSNTQDKIDEGKYPFYVRSPIIERSTKYLYDEEAVVTVGDGVGTGKVFHYVNGKYDLHQRCYRMFSFSDEVNAKYFYHVFSLLFYKRVMAMTAKTSVDSVRYEMIADMEIPFPNIEEQKKIVATFDNLDNLITLHQRKCDNLKTLKKSMLQKMFPKNGESVPEIRFAGFTDPWEQRKFYEIFNFMQNNALSRAELSNDYGEVMNVHYGDILVKYGEILDVKKDEVTYLLNSELLKKYQTSVLQNGDIIIADAAEDETVGKCSEITGLSNEIVLSGLHTIPCRPKEKYAKGYLGFYMNSNAYHDQLLPLLQGTKVSSISKSAIQDTNIVYPKSETEQTKIGSYFQSLDNLITLHQRKVEKLKEIKKSMLQKMFV